MRSILRFIPALLIIISACHKHDTNSYVDLSSYPLKSGDNWTYQVFDSINNVTDTALFSITGSYTLNGGPIYYTTTTVISGTVVDSGLIVLSGDSVMYQPSGNGLFSDLTLLFPLSQGSKWHTRYYGDSVSVNAVNLNRTVLGTTYDSVYNIVRVQSVPDLYIHQTIYIAADIGIIEATCDIMPWIPQHKTIRLIKYSIH